jgi:phosphoglycerate dehydrogenase-like enzyme
MHEVADAVVLIVGYGSIGWGIEARLSPFGAKFVRIASTAHEEVEPISNLGKVLPSAHIVVLAIPLTSETRHLFDARLLASMKPGALCGECIEGTGC